MNPHASPAIAIIVAERGPDGARLVAIDARGDRQFALLTPPASRARDTHPAVSPDGAWIVFASSRGRDLGVTSLWIAPLGAAQTPRALTGPTAIDANPVWTRDGTAIIFASTRDGGDFDLWRLPMRAGRAAGPPIQLTHAAGHEVAPTVARDGTIIFAAVTPRAEALTETTQVSRARTSHLVQRAPDGTLTALTDGPDDGSPALSPDETQLVFTCAGGSAELENRELCIAPRDALRTAHRLVELPPTDEDSPTWSPDGRYVLATSLVRGARTMLFSSAIAIELTTPPVARILVDHAGAVARLTPVIAPRSAPDLAVNPAYLPTLARIMTRAIEAQRQADEARE